MCLQNIGTQYYCAGNNARVPDSKSPWMDICN
jgi:hypothetical protein